MNKVTLRLSNRHVFVILSLLLAYFSAYAQTEDDPLKSLEYYMGEWGPPLDHPMVKNNPKMKGFRVISLEWGQNRKVIWSKTGIESDGGYTVFSEGIISYNPLSKKIVWLEYQHENEILFEGEYVPLDDGGLQRVYTVYYTEGYESIPNPQVEGWTRLFRETFIPTSENTIDWLTEAFVDGDWVKYGRNGGDFKAVRYKQ